MNEKEQNFEEIYDSYRAKIYRYLTRMIGADEAEDLTQEVFIKVNKGLTKFKGESGISTWIYRIATNTAVDRIRSLSRKSASNLIDEDELFAEDQSAWNDKVLSVDQKLIENEMNECVRNYINTLPENYRSVLVLSELEVLKNLEIAEILGLTLDTVKIRLHRARARLKKVLQGKCNFYYNVENQLA